MGDSEEIAFRKKEKEKENCASSCVVRGGA
jgi:hypothetical protein